MVFAHIPLWTVYPEWGWGTDDGAQALLLKRFGSVTVLNGHIHQIMQKVEGNVAFHTARSTAFPQPAPGTAPSPGADEGRAGRATAAMLGVAESAGARPGNGSPSRHAARRLTGAMSDALLLLAAVLLAGSPVRPPEARPCRGPIDNFAFAPPGSRSRRAPGDLDQPRRHPPYRVSRRRRPRLSVAAARHRRQLLLTFTSRAHTAISARCIRTCRHRRGEMRAGRRLALARVAAVPRSADAVAGASASSDRLPHLDAAYNLARWLVRDPTWPKTWCRTRCCARCAISRVSRRRRACLAAADRPQHGLRPAGSAQAGAGRDGAGRRGEHDPALGLADPADDPEAALVRRQDSRGSSGAWRRCRSSCANVWCCGSSRSFRTRRSRTSPACRSAR